MANKSCACGTRASACDQTRLRPLLPTLHRRQSGGHTRRTRIICMRACGRNKLFFYALSHTRTRTVSIALLPPFDSIIPFCIRMRLLVGEVGLCVFNWVCVCGWSTNKMPNTAFHLFVCCHYYIMNNIVNPRAGGSVSHNPVVMRVRNNIFV